MPKHARKNLIRAQFDFTVGLVARVDTIVTMIEAASRAEVFRRAFTVFEMLVKAAASGKKIIIDDGERRTELFIS